MAIPFYIKYFSERIGKPVSNFTKKDWQQAAIGSASLVDKYYDQTHPPHKQSGSRSKKIINALLRSLSQPEAKGKKGRPSQEYYGYPAAAIYQILDGAKQAMLKECPGASRTKRDSLKNLLSILKEKKGGNHDLPSDLRSVERALRRVKSGHNSK